MMDKGWIGVDLDGTLAYYDGWKGAGIIGDPVPLMADRVKSWLEEGKNVKIFSARANPRNVGVIQEILSIRKWCIKHFGVDLDITHEKDYHMIELWDDRAIQVIPNTGERVDKEAQNDNNN